MMTVEQAIDLGRRMMACEGFEWRAGMRHFGGIVSEGEWMHRRVPAAQVPDPRDPGTVGHALAMMRALADGIGTGIPHCVPNPQNRYELSTRPAWGVMACGTPLGLGDTEAEAVINAWEALS